MRLKCFSSTFFHQPNLGPRWNLQFEEKPMLKVRAVSFVGLPFLWLSLASARDLPLQCWAFLGFVASKWIAARSRCLFPGMAFSRSKKNDRSLGKNAVKRETTANVYLAVWFKVPKRWIFCFHEWLKLETTGVSASSLGSMKSHKFHVLKWGISTFICVGSNCCLFETSRHLNMNISH